MDSYVVKVRYENVLRRLTLGGGEVVFSYADLESRTRDLFRLPASSRLVLTYVDQDNDVVTMADDQDLRDALVVQSLNPLRLSVTIVTENSGIDVQQESQNSIVQDQTATTDGRTIAPGSLNSSPSPVIEEVLANVNKFSFPAVAEGDLASDGQVPAETSNSTSPQLAKEVPAETSNSTSPQLAKEAPAEISNSSSPQLAKKVAEPSTTVKNVEHSEGPEAAGLDADAIKAEVNLHYGIECDGCGMAPLEGPRFKSCKQSDYDLCHRCFETSGADPNDYFKIDRSFYHIVVHPLMERMMQLAQALESEGAEGPISSQSDPSTSNAGAASGSNATGKEAIAAEKSSVDSESPPVTHHGVQCDGCGMSPLVGPRFKSCTKFNYDLCLGCFEKSASSSAEYCRIDQPGHPHPLFLVFPHRIYPGRRIWVLSHMVPVGPVDESATKDGTPATRDDVDSHGEETAEKRTGDNPVGKDAGAQSTTAPAPATRYNVDIHGEEAGDKRTGDDPVGQDAGAESTTTPAPDADPSTGEGILAKLAAMGFADQKLNAELLERNFFDLRRTLDDLCAAEDWNPILEELLEMGFYDTDLNRRLMFKYGGSVKLVVKELVQLYKEPSAVGKLEKQA